MRRGLQQWSHTIFRYFSSSFSEKKKKNIWIYLNFFFFFSFPTLSHMEFPSQGSDLSHSFSHSWATPSFNPLCWAGEWNPSPGAWRNDADPLVLRGTLFKILSDPYSIIANKQSVVNHYINYNYFVTFYDAEFSVCLCKGLFHFHLNSYYSPCTRHSLF